MSSMTGRIVKGAVAGAAGVLAMDLFRFVRSRQRGSDASFLEWELSSSTASFDDAPAPAQVARLVADRAGVELPDAWAGRANNVVHWLTGVGYGIAHGLVDDGRSGVATGARSGVAAFLNSYAVLGALGLYEPMWEYEPAELAEDLVGHLGFGIATGVTYAALSREDR